MKTFMERFAPTAHRKELECCCPDDCGKTYLLTHLACSAGCYGCPESHFKMELVSLRGHALDSQSETEEESELEEAAEESQEESRSWAESMIEQVPGAPHLEVECSAAYEDEEEKSVAGTTRNEADNSSSPAASSNAKTTTAAHRCHLGEMD